MGVNPSQLPKRYTPDEEERQIGDQTQRAENATLSIAIPFASIKGLAIGVDGKPCKRSLILMDMVRSDLCQILFSIF